jgi:hypothetical protein
MALEQRTGISPGGLSTAIDAGMVMSKFFPIKRHRFLVRTKHRSGSPSEKQSFNGLDECGPLETKCVVDEAQAKDAARRIDVQLAVGVMGFRDTDERRAEQTVPGADIGLARTDRTEVDIARGTFLPGPAMAYGQPAELCKHFGRWVAWGSRCRQ